MTTTSAKGYAVLKAFEGRSLKAYRDPVGVWTIGYGNTNADLASLRTTLGRPDFNIKSGVVITDAEADKLLQVTATKRYEPAVNRAMPNAKQNEFDAGLSFHWNTGAIGRAGWVASWRARNMAAVQPQLKAWNKAGGRVLAGLVRRRAREWAMVANNDYGPEGRSAAPVRPVVPTAAPTSNGSTPAAPPWLERMESILGLYEFPGGQDNPAVLAMARQCNDSIRRAYVHDSIPWCALTVEWCLVTTGYKGSGTLWALDVRKVGTKLSGPCVGALATMTREGGGHVAMVRGRTRDGKLVLVGGNQSDMVCDATVALTACKFNWPSGYVVPSNIGFDSLPVVTPRAKVKRRFNTLPTAAAHPASQNANPPVAGPGMLRLNDKGQEVKDLQDDLVRNGYPMRPYGADGTFGASTKAAVLDFQKRHPQLEPTGIADPATRAALKRTSAAKDQTTRTGTVGTTAEAATGATDATGHAQDWFSVPHEVYWGIGLVALAVIAYYGWKYRDEIKAMFRAKFADANGGEDGPESGRSGRRGPDGAVPGDAAVGILEVPVAKRVSRRPRVQNAARKRGGRARRPR